MTQLPRQPVYQQWDNKGCRQIPALGWQCQRSYEESFFSAALSARTRIQRHIPAELHVSWDVCPRYCWDWSVSAILICVPRLYPAFLEGFFNSCSWENGNQCQSSPWMRKSLIARSLVPESSQISRIENKNWTPTHAHNLWKTNFILQFFVSTLCLEILSVEALETFIFNLS